MEKKGQVFVLVVVAIVIVIGLVVFFFIKANSDRENLGREYFEQEGLTPSVNNIQDFIGDCLEVNAKDALVKIGVQGGYYNEPPLYFDMQWAFIPYYYDRGRILQPSLGEIEKELASYVDDNLDSCLGEINFRDLDLSFGLPSTSVKIRGDEAIFNSDLKVVIEREGNSVNFELGEHPVIFNSSLEDIFEVAEYITESHRQDEELMCINCITELAKERALYVDFISFSEDTTLVMILENRTMEEPYIFEFLNRYNINE